MLLPLLHDSVKDTMDEQIGNIDDPIENVLNLKATCAFNQEGKDLLDRFESLENKAKKEFVNSLYEERPKTIKIGDIYPHVLQRCPVAQDVEDLLDSLREGFVEDSFKHNQHLISMPHDNWCEGDVLREVDGRFLKGCSACLWNPDILETLVGMTDEELQRLVTGCKYRGCKFAHTSGGHRHQALSDAKQHGDAQLRQALSKLWDPKTDDYVFNNAKLCKLVPMEIAQFMIDLANDRKSVKTTVEKTMFGVLILLGSAAAVLQKKPIPPKNGKEILEHCGKKICPALKEEMLSAESKRLIYNAAIALRESRMWRVVRSLHQCNGIRDRGASDLESLGEMMFSLVDGDNVVKYLVDINSGRMPDSSGRMVGLTADAIQYITSFIIVGIALMYPHDLSHCIRNQVDPRKSVVATIIKCVILLGVQHPHIFAKAIAVRLLCVCMCLCVLLEKCEFSTHMPAAVSDEHRREDASARECFSGCGLR